MFAANTSSAIMQSIHTALMSLDVTDDACLMAVHSLAVPPSLAAAGMLDVMLRTSLPSSLDTMATPDKAEMSETI